MQTRTRRPSVSALVRRRLTNSAHVPHTHHCLVTTRKMKFSIKSRAEISRALAKTLAAVHLAAIEHRRFNQLTKAPHRYQSNSFRIPLEELHDVVQLLVQVLLRLPKSCSVFRLPFSNSDSSPDAMVTSSCASLTRS